MASNTQWRQLKENMQTKISDEHNTKLKQFLINFFQDKEFSLISVEGDAGLRSYYRVTTHNKNFILMDCPPSYTDTAPFVKIAQYLNSIDLTAPKIHSHDRENGFVLLQDFGNLSAGSFLKNIAKKNSASSENTTSNGATSNIKISNIKTSTSAPLPESIKFYKLAIDVLYQLQQNSPPPDLSSFTDELLISELDLFNDWYIPYATGKKFSTGQIKDFQTIWQSIMTKRPRLGNTTVLRDYHVENIMILVNQDGPQNGFQDISKNQNNIKSLNLTNIHDLTNIHTLGLLDFQDALLGSPIYDLVSILEDARITVPRDLAIQLFKYYVDKTQIDYQQAWLEYSILGAQRNMRILGVFARKALRDNANNYLKFIPIVLKYINHDLSHPALSELFEWLNQNVNELELTR